MDRVPGLGCRTDLGLPLRTRDTVLTPTPANSATSLIVTTTVPPDRSHRVAPWTRCDAIEIGPGGTVVVTINDVAEFAGVGVSTVSRVLNGSPRSARRPGPGCCSHRGPGLPAQPAGPGAVHGPVPDARRGRALLHPRVRVERVRGVVAALDESRYDLVLFNVESPGTATSTSPPSTGRTGPTACSSCRCRRPAASSNGSRMPAFRSSSSTPGPGMSTGRDRRRPGRKDRHATSSTSVTSASRSSATTRRTCSASPSSPGANGLPADAGRGRPPVPTRARAPRRPRPHGRPATHDSCSRDATRPPPCSHRRTCRPPVCSPPPLRGTASSRRSLGHRLRRHRALRRTSVSRRCGNRCSRPAARRRTAARRWPATPRRQVLPSRAGDDRCAGGPLTGPSPRTTTFGPGRTSDDATGTQQARGVAHMAEIVLDDVWKVYPDGTEAVRALDLDDRRRGVHRPRRAVRVRQDHRAAHGRRARGDLTRRDRRSATASSTIVPPKERDIAMVFQNYALYPHMTVFDNMAFGLKLQRMPKRARSAARVHEPRASSGSTSC